MLCAECQSLLSDYLDGDLADGPRVAIDAHLRDCARCASLRNDLLRIIHASASLPAHTPSARVWEGIHQEIVGGGNVVAGPRAWWNRMGARRFEVSISARQLVGAAAAAVILGSAFVVYRGVSATALPHAGWQGIMTTSAADHPAPVLLATVEGRDKIRQLRTSVDDMAAQVAAHRASWSPELEATYAKGLTDLDGRIDACQKTFDDRGTDVEPLLDALRKKLNFLEEFARVEGAPQSRKS